MRLTDTDNIRSSIYADVLETVDDVRCCLGIDREKLSSTMNCTYCTFGEMHLYVKYKDPATGSGKRSRVVVEFTHTWVMRSTYLDCVLGEYTDIKRHPDRNREILFKYAASYITRYCKSFIADIDFEVYDVKLVENEDK